MGRTLATVGCVTKILGLVGLVLSAITTIIDASRVVDDPSISVYVPLVVAEGVLYTLGWAVLMLLGRVIQRKGTKCHPFAP